MESSQTQSGSTRFPSFTQITFELDALKNLATLLKRKPLAEEAKGFLVQIGCPSPTLLKTETAFYSSFRSAS